jgi:hypothetical protein
MKSNPILALLVIQLAGVDLVAASVRFVETGDPACFVLLLVLPWLAYEAAH